MYVTQEALGKYLLLSADCLPYAAAAFARTQSHTHMPHVCAPQRVLLLLPRSPLQHLHAPASHMALQQPRPAHHSAAQVAQARAAAAAAAAVVGARAPARAAAAAAVLGRRPRHAAAAAACASALLGRTAAATA